jgi:hypothetical protein
MYVVILERRRHGAACGTTRDEVEAESAAEAEEFAIAAWRAVRADCTFAPLITTQQV